jgi:hypothetical protein
MSSDLGKRSGMIVFVDIGFFRGFLVWAGRRSLLSDPSLQCQQLR